MRADYRREVEIQAARIEAARHLDASANESYNSTDAAQHIDESCRMLWRPRFVTGVSTANVLVTDVRHQINEKRAALKFTILLANDDLDPTDKKTGRIEENEPGCG